MKIKNLKRIGAGLTIAVLSTSILTACGTHPSSTAKTDNSKAPIKIGIATSETGALESYGKQMLQGFSLGIDYATKGTKTVDGHPIQVIVEDTQTKPDIAKQVATKLLEDDKVDILVGSASSTDALAIEPLARRYKRVMVVEPAVADAITGSQWNQYVFRTGRDSSQDAIAGAAAIAKPGVKIATLAPDNAFGQDGVKAFKTAAEKLGAKIVREEFPAANATDFTANLERIISAKPDYLFVVWAGSNTPWRQISDMKLTDKGIKISTGAPDIATLKTMGSLVGMKGFSIYYYTLPKNPVNDWLVSECQKQYGQPPDLFTAGGMSAAIAIVTALEKTGSDTNADRLISTMEGMSFESPKGTMTFRKEDHQALQTIYAIRLEKQQGVAWPVPVLERELTPEETAPPIQNQR